MALVRDPGRPAYPTVPTNRGATFSVGLIVAVLAFSASIDKLFDHPPLFGWNWDVQIGDAFAPATADQMADLLADPAATDVAAATTARVEIGGELVDALAVEPRKGRLEPVVVEGRAPAAPDEALLGTRTLRDLGAGIGDTVDVELSGRSASFTVVGRGVLAEFAGGARLGEGAAVSFDGLRRLLPDASADLALVRTSDDRAGLALRNEILGAGSGNVYVPTAPSDLSELGRRGGPLSLLAGLLAAAGVATLAYALASSVRRRRRELAILKVLGFVRRQLWATVAWQSSVIAGLAIAAGLVLGVGAGQFAWRLFADQLGVPPRPAAPLLSMGVVALVTFLLANLTAALPARVAARTKPNVVLRNE
jgi:putative ABC transport system permease protein